MGTDIHELRILLSNKRWSNQMTRIQKDEKSDDDELISDIKKRIKIVRKKKTEFVSSIIKKVDMTKLQMKSKQPIIINNDMSPLFSEIEQYIYKKPWLRLQEYHKIVKLREYVKSLEAKERDKKNLEELLINKLKNKELKNKQVTYMPEKEKIMNIKGVKELDKYQVSDSDSSNSDDNE
jgi:hypothetical protein